MGSKIDLVFQAIDKASAIIANIDRSMQNLGGSARGLNSAMDGALMGAGMAAFETAIGVAGAAFDGLISKFNEAGKVQTDTIGNAGGLAIAMGKSFADVEPIIDSINKTIDTTFGSLPGVNKMYKDISGGIVDNLIPAVKELDGSINEGKLKNLSLELSKTFGIISTAQGVDSSETLKALQRFIGGDASVKNLQLFDQGVGKKVFDEITAKLQGQNKELKELTEKERIELLNEVGQKFINPDMLKKYVDSYEGAIATMQSAMDSFTNFNQKLEGRNNQTVLQAATDVLTSIMDLFSTIGSGLGFSATGFQEGLFDGLKSLAGFIDQVTVFSQSILDVFSSGDFSTQMSDIILIFYGLGDKMADGFYSWMESVDWGQLLIDLGNVALVVFAALGAFVAGWTARAVPALIGMAANFIDTFNYGILGMFQSMGEAISSFWTTSVAPLITTATTAITGLWNSITTGLSNMFSSLGSAISSAIASFNPAELGQQLGQKIIDAAKGVASQVTGQPMSYSYDAQPGAGRVNGDTAYSQVNNIKIEIMGAVTPAIAQETAEKVVEALDYHWSQYRLGFNAIAVRG